MRCAVIYFIEEVDGPGVKIGWTRNTPERRLRALQVGNSQTLRVVGTLEGGPELEREIGRDCRHAHLRGEWFDKTDLKVRAWILRSAANSIGSERVEDRLIKGSNRRARSRANHRRERTGHRHLTAEWLAVAVRELLDELPKDQQAVINCLYVAGWNRTRTAQELGFTADRVRELEELALADLSSVMAVAR